MSARTNVLLQFVCSCLASGSSDSVVGPDVVAGVAGDCFGASDFVKRS